MRRNNCSGVACRVSKEVLFRTFRHCGGRCLEVSEVKTSVCVGSVAFFSTFQQCSRMSVEDDCGDASWEAKKSRCFAAVDLFREE